MLSFYLKFHLESCLSSRSWIKSLPPSPTVEQSLSRTLSVLPNHNLVLVVATAYLSDCVQNVQVSSIPLNCCLRAKPECNVLSKTPSPAVFNLLIILLICLPISFSSYHCLSPENCTRLLVVLPHLSSTWQPEWYFLNLHLIVCIPIHPHTHTHTHYIPHCCSEHKKEINMKATEMYIDRWMDNEVVVHIPKGILLIPKKERIWLSSNEVDEPRAYSIEWNNSEREK